MKKVREAVSWIKKNGLFPNPPVVHSPHMPEVKANGKDVLMFATNNYLGMTVDPRVKAAAVEGAEKWGIGNGSARLLTGNLEMHHRLEQAIADFKYRPAALTFISGYAVNQGSIPALVNVFDPSVLSILHSKILKKPDTVVFSDEYNHASIVAGIRLSRAPKEIYKHVNVADLAEKLSKYPKSKRKMIITDGVFSMDGNIAPLPEILELARKHNASVYLDDAHATGILGEHGRGVEDYFNVEGESDVVMGTFTKAFGGVGGFIASDDEVIDYLKVMAGSFVFTAPISPPVVYGLIKSIEIVKDETWRREKVLENAQYLREKLHSNGYNTYNSSTQIIPVRIGDEKKAIDVSDALLERDILIPAARWPAVPKKEARLRITVTCDHTKDQLDHLINKLNEVRKSFPF